MTDYPSFALSAGQAQYLTNGIQPLAGVFGRCMEDPTTSTEYRYLVDAIDELGDGNWSVVMDPMIQKVNRPRTWYPAR